MSKPPECEWLQDQDYDKWDTACGEAACFITDGPKENRYTYCPWCGRLIKASPAVGERE